MTARPTSSGAQSSSTRSVDNHLPVVLDLNKNVLLPEEWTLLHEWKIEKREKYDNWKVDVQNQIANIATLLKQSLQHYPHPEVGSRFDYSDKVAHAEMQKLKRTKELM